MHHGTDTLDSLAALDFPVIWGGWSSPAPARPKPVQRSLWIESLVWLSGGLAFAAVVSLTVALLAVLD